MTRERFRISHRMRRLYLAAVATALATSMLAVTSAGATRAAGTACAPTTTILKSPRPSSREVQAKALNDHGDVVGFADTKNGAGPIHAILWKRGRVAGAVDLGLLPGYISSEAYGVNNDRVVYGVLYDKKERPFPFRWKNGRMTLLRDPAGHLRPVSLPDPSKNAINVRGEIAATLIVAGNLRAVRWTRDGKATFLPALPGHTWTWAYTVNDGGVVSGWSRKRPKEHAVEKPVIWTSSGTVVPLKFPSGRGDGVAGATNRAGLTVGLLGNPGTDKDPESDQAAVWSTSTSEPQLLGPATSYAYAELFDVNDRGQAAGGSGTFTKNGFPVVRPAIWQRGWTGLRILSIPAASRVNPVVVAALDDINAHGTMVGNVYGLAAKDYGALRRIDPVLWTCAFGR
jgi:probable HAF family extracellular repeat protein